MMDKLDIKQIRADFPILARTIYDRPLVYFDNAATTQKPMVVLDAMREEYLNVNANVHRGVHWLSQQATDLHEQARETVRRFINARSTNEIVFTRGTTEGLNLIASSFAESMMKAGDEVIISTVEHHSNIVPWQLQATRKGIVLRVIPMDDYGRMDVQALRNMINERTKIISISQVSNVLGTINPIDEVIRMAHEYAIPVVVDGAQSTPHFKVDMQQMDCDFFVFSGHKIYGPTGIGVLYGKEAWLEQLPPYQGGGEMIAHVSFEGSTFEQPPLKFEAGTPDYIATNGLAKALDYVSAIGMDAIQAHEEALTKYAIRQLQTIEGMHLYGIPQDADLDTLQHDAVLSFQVKDIHHMDMGTLLDHLGIAIRTGHHCAQPLMQRLGVLGTARASFAFYNTFEEVNALVAAIKRIATMF